MISLFGIRNCDSCRKARKWLEANHLEFHFQDIRDEALEERLLKKWQQQTGWETLLNKKSITWRKIPAFDRNNLDADRARALILEYPTVMKRPVLDTGTLVLVGFDATEYATLGS